MKGHSRLSIKGIILHLTLFGIDLKCQTSLFTRFYQAKNRCNSSFYLKRSDKIDVNTSGIDFMYDTRNTKKNCNIL